MNKTFDPELALTQVRREFGEHGGVAPSIERSSTFTVMEPGHMPEIFSGKLPQHGITTSLVNPRNMDAFAAAITSKTKVLYTETIGNPTLAVANIRALADLASAHGITLVVDNTFSPMLISPARHGAHVVVHSMTKYISGASDLLAGCICCSREFGHALYDLHTGSAMLLGPTMDPRVAFDIIQRLPHLPIRMREHGKRALAIATRLTELNVPVIYPGLPDHPDHDLLISLANPGYGYGGMLAIDCGTAERANELIGVLQNEVNFGLIAVSLGYFDTLMSVSSCSTSSEISNDQQKEMALSEGLLRISVGLTGSLESRLEQIERGVRKVFS